jgi:hypothetical protein
MKQLARGASAAAVLLVLAGWAGAAERTGRTGSGLELLRDCEGRGGDNQVQNAMMQLHCYGYLNGFTDGVRLGSSTSQAAGLCLPADGVAVEQVVLILTKWLRDHPETLHETARMSLFISLLQAFRCRSR